MSKKKKTKGKPGRPKGSKNKAKEQDKRVQGILKQIGAERPELPPMPDPDDKPLFDAYGNPILDPDDQFEQGQHSTPITGRN